MRTFLFLGLFLSSVASIFTDSTSAYAHNSHEEICVIANYNYRDWASNGGGATERRGKRKARREAIKRCEDQTGRECYITEIQGISRQGSRALIRVCAHPYDSRFLD